MHLPQVLAQEDDVALEDSNQGLAKARQLMIEGTDLLHSNQNQQAKLKLASACVAAPDLPQAHHQLGIALAKLGENDEAINEFSTAIKLDANLAASWLNLAAVYQSSGQVEKAKATYQQFVERFPKDSDIAKIRSLIAILNKEAVNQVAGGVENPDSAAGVSDSAGNAGSSVANAKRTMDDYYAEVTSHGVFQWANGHLPLAVYVEPANSRNVALPQYINILQNAFRDWVGASEGRISVNFVSEPSKAVIICSWSKDVAKFKNSSEAANTKIYADKSGLTKGEIEILTISKGEGGPITDNQARATCLHEVGHVLGLTGHSNNPEDVMYMSASLKDAWINLSNRDKNTIMHLYSGNN